MKVEVSEKYHPEYVLRAVPPGKMPKNNKRTGTFIQYYKIQIKAEFNDNNFITLYDYWEFQFYSSDRI